MISTLGLDSMFTTLAQSGYDTFLDAFTSSGFDGPLTPKTALLAMLLAFTIGHLIGWVYAFTHQGLSYSQMFTASLVVLPVLVSLVMLLMSNSLVIAFGLLAVFAVVRFRNVLKDTRDTTFVLWSIVEGMACGTQNFSLAVIGAVFVFIVFLYLRFTAFGGRHRYDVVLSLQLIGDLVGAVQSHRDILRRHSNRIQLASERKLTDSGLDLSYRLLLRDPSRSNELLTELESSDGIENVSLFMREDESEI